MSAVLKQLAIATFRPFEENFSSILKSLNFARETIDKEITLSSEQELHIDRMNNAQLRTNVRDLCHFTQAHYQDYQEDRIKVSDTARQSKRKRVLRNISKYPYYSEFTDNLQKRIENSGLWIYKTPEYDSWFQSSDSAGLWLQAIPGFGKSVLAAGIIDNLLQLSRSQRSQRYHVAYFFCTYAIPSSLLSRTVLLSLLHQLFYYSKDLPMDLTEDIESRFEDKVGSSRVVLTDIQLFIRNIIEKNQAINYIVVDGIDECNDKERGVILRTLKKILDDVPQDVKILVSSRGSQDIARALQNFQHLDLGTSNQDDVEAFISQMLHNKELEGQLPELPEDMFAKIKSFLSENAKGLFIWVGLQIEEICKESRLEDIEAVLPTLPKDLDELYDRVITRIVRFRRPEVAQEIFKWVAYAIRPLTLEELKEATCLKNLDIETGSWTELHKLAELDESKWLQNCENLVVVNKDRRTVQFAHFTVKEFLESGKCSEGAFSMNRTSHSELADACTRYYQFPEIVGPASQHQRTTVSKERLNSLATLAINPIQKDASWAGWMTQRFFKQTLWLSSTTYASPSAVSTALITTRDSNIVASQKQGFKYMLQAHPFLEYATSCWIFHFQEKLDPELLENFKSINPLGVPKINLPEDLIVVPSKKAGSSSHEFWKPIHADRPSERKEGKEFEFCNDQDMCLLALKRFKTIRFPWQNYFTPESLSSEEYIFGLLDWALENGIERIFESMSYCCYEASGSVSGLDILTFPEYWCPVNYTPGSAHETRLGRLCSKKDANTRAMWKSVFRVLEHERLGRNLVSPGPMIGGLSKRPEYVPSCIAYACQRADYRIFNYLIEVLSYLPKTFSDSRFRHCKCFNQKHYKTMVEESIVGDALEILQVLHHKAFLDFTSQLSPEDQFELLELAIRLGRTKCFGVLVPKYRFGLSVSHPNRPSILQQAVESGSEDIVGMCLQRSTDLLSRSLGNRLYPLQIAALSNDLGIIKLMAPFLNKTNVPADMVPPRSSDTALTYAIKHRNVAMAQVLLDAGANLKVAPHRQLSELDVLDDAFVISSENNYPMLQFASTPSEEMLRLFLKIGDSYFLRCLQFHLPAARKLLGSASRDKTFDNSAWVAVVEMLKDELRTIIVNKGIPLETVEEEFFGQLENGGLELALAAALP
ncbi:hypothetical protein TWF718_006300 [Orbilia javanica]|uniref:NACHT domain-containing protein n=1 Tax=Orbilia javanica TaxID=47235 RepID=A0AAN8N9C0_9PEZI